MGLVLWLFGALCLLSSRVAGLFGVVVHRYGYVIADDDQTVGEAVNFSLDILGVFDIRISQCHTRDFFCATPSGRPNAFVDGVVATISLLFDLFNIPFLDSGCPISCPC